MHHDTFLSPDFLHSSGSQLKVLPQLQAQDLQPDAKIKTKCLLSSTYGIVVQRL